ncbi:MAG TPA: phosphoribosylamine--glycine ligase [Pyrinomonadaceae bacterium]|nr:phosphoribosylamine--glycine ligase [Pyrinomonadaceae bacterium]
MKVLVVGSGGREHALCWAINETASESAQLYCAPGNAGIAQLAECVALSIDDHVSLIDFAQSNQIELTIIGPEAPLANGIVDDFQSSGLAVIGPSKAAARLESSKAFAKDFMRRHAIPTADFVVADSSHEAILAVRSGRFGAEGSPVVIKVDGLAAGKGVVVAPDHAGAERAIEDLVQSVSREAANQILIEEALDGREVSILLFADGRDYALMPPARDHKRVGDGDTGPNTGGMGAVTDPSILDDSLLEQIKRAIIEPTLAGAESRGYPFHGILFIGLMLTAAGPKVLEYNVRFGDPETQAILIRLNTDLVEIFRALDVGRLRDVDVQWKEGSSACVVMASEGYPGAYESGRPIEGLEEVIIGPDFQVFHAGTAWADNAELVTAGGRVLGVTARNTTLDEALQDCYRATDRINWPGKVFRRDIGRFINRHDASSVESTM